MRRLEDIEQQNHHHYHQWVRHGGDDRLDGNGRCARRHLAVVSSIAACLGPRCSPQSRQPCSRWSMASPSASTMWHRSRHHGPAMASSSRAGSPCAVARYMSMSGRGNHMGSPQASASEVRVCCAACSLEGSHPALICLNSRVLTSGSWLSSPSVQATYCCAQSLSLPAWRDTEHCFHTCRRTASRPSC